MTANTEDIIRDLEEDLKHIKDAAPSFDSWKRLTEIELPKLETDLQKLNQAKELLLEEYNQVSNCSAIYIKHAIPSS